MSRFYYIGSPVQLTCETRGLQYTMKRYGEVIASPAHQQKQEESRQAGRIPLGDIVDLSYMKDQLIQVFETEEDAAGIVIRELGKQSDAIRKHFRQPYIYQLAPEGGSFDVQKNVPPEWISSVRCAQKCCLELKSLLMEAAVPGESFEFYTCWAGQEKWPRQTKLDRDLNLITFEWEEGLQPLEKQYIRIFAPV